MMRGLSNYYEWDDNDEHYLDCPMHEDNRGEAEYGEECRCDEIKDRNDYDAACERGGV